MITVVGNLKGGTGKSTVAFNLSIWIATRRNVHVSIYDLDPQATITDALEIRSEDGYVPAMEPQHFVSQLGSEGKHTEVIVDIGLSDSEAMNAAIQRADRILIPVAPSQADVWSTQRFLKLISNVRKSGAKPEVLGFMNRSDTHRAVRETEDAFEALDGLDGITMLEPRLYQRTAYRRSFSEGMAVFEMDPKSKAAAEVEELGQVLY